VTDVVRYQSVIRGCILPQSLSIQCRWHKTSTCSFYPKLPDIYIHGKRPSAVRLFAMAVLSEFLHLNCEPFRSLPPTIVHFGYQAQWGELLNGTIRVMPGSRLLRDNGRANRNYTRL
jgi:hypothetical protein